MSNLSGYTRRVLTTILATALVLTAMPAGVFASEIEDADPVAIEVQENENAAEAGEETFLEEEPVAEEPAQASDDQVPGDEFLEGEKVITFNLEGVGLSAVTNASKDAETGVWTWDTEGEYITFDLKAEDHYSFDLATEGKGSLQVTTGDEVLVIEPAGDAESGFTVIIPREKVTGDAAFNVVATGVENPKYTVEFYGDSKVTFGYASDEINKVYNPDPKEGEEKVVPELFEGEKIYFTAKANTGNRIATDDDGKEYVNKTISGTPVKLFKTAGESYYEITIAAPETGNVAEAVEIPTIETKIATFTSVDKNVYAVECAKLRYDDETEEWKPVGDISFSLTDVGNIRKRDIVVDLADRICIKEFTYEGSDDEMAATVVSVVKEGDAPLTEDKDGYYTTAAVADDIAITIETAKNAPVPESDDVTYNEGKSGTYSVVSGTVTLDGKERFTKDAFKFTIVPDGADDKVTAVRYSFLVPDATENPEEFDALRTGNANEFMIPAAQAKKAIISGGIKLRAVVEGKDAKRDINIYEPINVKKVEAREYKVTYTSEVPNYSEVTGKDWHDLVYVEGATTEEVEPGNVLMLKVTPNERVESGEGKTNGAILLDDSVEDLRKNVSIDALDESFGALAGCYPVAPYAIDDGSMREICMMAYELPSIKAVEAKGKTFKDTDEKVFTATLITSPVTEADVRDSSAKILANSDFKFSYALATGMEEYVILERPSVMVGEGEEATVIPVDGPESGIAGTYTIAKKDIEDAIKAGENITINAAAEAIEFNKVELTVPEGSGISKIKIEAKDKTGTKEIEETVASNKANFFVRSGAAVKITGVTLANTALNEATIVNINKKDGYVDSTFTLGTIAEDSTFEVKTATLPCSTNIIITPNPASSDDWIFTANVDDSDIVTVGSDKYVKATAILGGGLGFETNLSEKPTSKIDYRIKEPAKYTVTTEPAKSGNVRSNIIPASVLYAMAYSTKSPVLTVTVDIAEDGLFPVGVVFKADEGQSAESFEARIGGKRIKTADLNKIQRGKNVDFTVDADWGYELKSIFYATQARMDEIYSASGATTDAEFRTYLNGLTTTLPDDLHKVEETNTFTIEKIDDNYSVWAITKPVNVLYVKDYSEKEYVISGNAEFDQPYNNTATIVMKKGSASVNLNDTAAWEVKATIPDETEGTTVDVFDKALEVFDTNYLKFKKQTGSDILQGKTVTVTIASKADGGPKYEVAFNVSTALPAGTIKFADSEAVTVNLGGYETIPVTITAPEDVTVNKDNYKIVAKIGTDELTKADFTTGYEKEDGTEIFVAAHVDKAARYTGDITLSLVDPKDEGTVFASKTVKIKKNVVPGISLKEEGKSVAAKGDIDFFEIDFSSVAVPEDVGGLYWLVNAKYAGAPTPLPVGFVNDVTNKLIPVGTEKYNLVVTSSPDAFSADPVPYDIKVELVQLKSAVAIDYAVNEANSKTTPGNEFSKRESTSVDGTFATSIKFVKNKDATAIYGTKTIFNTMEKYPINLGHIDYVLKGSKTGPSVKRLKEVIIKNKAGETVADSGHPETGVEFDENSNIFITPYKLKHDGETVPPAGNYTLYAYAIEPKGYEVTAKTTLSIKQGISDIVIFLPSDTIYKAPGKKATLKATATYSPIKGTTKKVTWYLSKTENGEPATIPGVTINKSGVVTVDKDAAIPDDSVWVVAKAADYNGDYKDAPQYRMDSEKIDIVGESDPISYVKIGSTEIDEGRNYLSNQISGRIETYDSNGTPIEKVKYSVSGITPVKSAISKLVTVGEALKPVIKNASVTVTKTDGFKESKKIKFNIVSDTGLRAKLFDVNHAEMLTTTEPGNYTVTNTAASGRTLELYVDGSNGSLIDHKIAVKGASKKVSETLPTGVVYTITPNKDVTVITLTEKANNAVTTITINNNKIGAKTAAPKITASNIVDASYNAKKNEFVTKDNKGKIFSHLEFNDYAAYVAAGSYNKVTYNVKDAVAGDRVRISSSDDILAKILDDNAEMNVAITKTDKGEYDVVLGEGGTFVIDYSDAQNVAADVYVAKGKFDIKKGTYKFTVTKIDADGAALTKPATVKVTAAPAPKANVAAAKTTFNPLTNGEQIGFKTLNNVVVKTEKEGGKDYEVAIAGYDKFAGINEKGKISKFAYAFESGNQPLASRTTLNMTDRFKVINKTVLKNYDAKKGIQGYALVTWQNLDGSVGSKWVKLTVKGEIPAPTP